MPLPSITVVSDATGCHHPANSHAWWMGDAAVLIRAGVVDVDDAKAQVHRAMSLAGPERPDIRQHLRDAEVALAVARQHLARAQRPALHH